MNQGRQSYVQTIRMFFKNIESLFTVLTLLIYTGGPFVVIASGGLSEGEKATVDFSSIRLLFQVIYLITFLFLIPCWKKALYLLLKEKTILVLLGLVCLSEFWSVDPEATLNRIIAVIGTTLFGIYFATRYRLKKQLTFLGWTFSWVILLSILFAIVLPQYGIMAGTHTGAWRGIYTHKNTLGAMMVLSSITFLFLEINARRKHYWFLGGLGLSLALLLLSKASSPLVDLAILIPAFAIFRTFRWYYTVRTFIFFLTAFIGFSLTSLAILNAEALVGLLGKDLTFTGRSKIWTFVWEMISQRPWLGYGYGALWKDWFSETSYVWRAVGWEAPSAHNGFLELWLGLGLVGIVVFVVQFLLGLARSLALIKKVGTVECFLPLLLFLFTLLVNLTESTFLDRNSIYWVLYTAMLLSLVRNYQYQENFSPYQTLDQKTAV